MCGLAGFVGYENATEGRLRLERMQRSLHHRGPDACGLFMDTQGQAGMAHTRLSILDPTERSDQPMHHQNRWTLTYNGEIYNFHELRAELAREGASFSTTSDTEVLLVLLARRGPEALGKLRGMFALAFWDAGERSLLLARDAFGIKPLYLTSHTAPLAFASEIRALLDGGWVPRRLDPTGVASYFKTGSCDPAFPLIGGVQALPPGSWMEWKNGHVRRGRIPPIPLDDANPSEDVTAFGNAFLDSVRSHLVSDVPMGLFLSGGIDSTAILTALHGQGLPMPTSLTLSFPGSDFDESKIASETASRFGSRHLIQKLDPGREIIPWFRNHLATQDLPSIDGFNVFCISRMAREAGLKVVLSGLGGDELLGGYPSFRQVPRIQQVGQMLHSVPWLAEGVACILRKGGYRGRRLADFLGGTPTISRAMGIYRQIFGDDQLAKLGFVPPPFTDASLDDGMQSHTPDVRIAVGRAEVDIYLRHQLLRDADACSMAHGVELRVPFLDVPLWNQAARLPLDTRFAPGKRLIGRALPGFPRELFRQPKRGFSLPWEEWLQGPLKPEWDAVPGEVKPFCGTWYQKMAWISFKAWEARVLHA